MMKVMSLSSSPTLGPPPTAIIPFRAPPGLYLDLDDIGPPPGLSLSKDLCIPVLRQASGGEQSTACSSSPCGSTNTSDSETSAAPTYSSEIRLRVQAPAFVPAEGLRSRPNKEPALVASPGGARVRLKTTAEIFTPSLPFVPKAEVDQGWQEMTEAGTKVQRTRRGVRGGRRARRSKGEKLSFDEQLRREDKI